MARPHRRRRIGFPVATVLLAVLVPSPAPAAPIDDARARAGQLQRQIEEGGRQISIMAERYNQSRLRVAGVEAAIAKTSSDIEVAARRMQDVRRRLAQVAVLAYVSGGTTSRVAQITRGGSDLVVRSQYLRLTAADQRQVVGELRAAREDLLGRRSRLEADRRAARTAEAAAALARRQVLEAESAHRRTLAGVRGELARLVAEEAARREAAATRRVPEPGLRPVGGEPTRSGLRGPPPPNLSLPPSVRTAAVVEEARRQLGKPYVWGGSGPASFDCSGLTGWAWRSVGVRLSHSAYLQYTETARVPVDQLQPGDLLFFGPNVRGIHHNALYIGNGQMIEASQSGTPVRIRGWRSGDLVGAGRPG